MPKLHANMGLEFDLDDRLDIEKTAAEIKRSYAFVAGSIGVFAHHAHEGPVENDVRMNISLHAPYWDGSDEKAQENWPLFKPWLEEKLTKVSQVFKRYNGDRAGSRVEPVDYAWLELVFKGQASLALRLQAHSALPERTLELIESIRDAVASTRLGDKAIALVRAPSRMSFAEQADLHVREAHESDSAADDEAPADPLADPSGCEASPDFPVDYAVWGIDYVDGSHAEFDSSTGMLRRG